MYKLNRVPGAEVTSGPECGETPGDGGGPPGHSPSLPLHGVKETFGIIETLYKASDVPDGCALVVGDGGHRFYADDAWPVMKGLLAKR